MTEQINYNNPFVIIFLTGTILSFAVRLILKVLNWQNRKKTGNKIPEEILSNPSSACLNKEKIENITKYENQKFYFSLPSSFLNLVLTIILVCTGFYPWIFQKIVVLTGFPNGFMQTYLCALLFFILSSVPESILSIPLDLLFEFKIEKKFGFSKMTFKLWLTDFFKNTILSLVMTSILLGAAIAVLNWMPNTWWILLTCLLFAFTLIIQVLYPMVIAPMFNKFTPLEDGELKNRITNLMTNLGFKSDGIFVMDASKRSGHSNAYFGGLGKSKRIVLYDTLISQLTTDELEAVLGHELGHYKLKHIIKKFLVMVPIEFILMFVLYKIAQNPSIYIGFGFPFAGYKIQAVQFIGLFLSALVAGSLQEFLNPIVNYFSRKDEYQADAFSADLTKNPDALISGLIKLNCENLSDLNPAKSYAFWNYSHPTLKERIIALNKLK